MKTAITKSCFIALAATIVVLTNTAIAQTSKDTVKTGAANDKMVVKPGKTRDTTMVMKPSIPNDGMVVLSDTGFINKNIKDNFIEVQMARMALSKGTGAQIKKIASQIMTDHNAMAAQLRNLAAKKGAQKPAKEGMPAGMDMPPIPPVKTDPATTYNAAWASMMLTMHEDKIAELEKYLAVTQDDDIKLMIGTALPKIRAHRELLKQVPGAKIVAGANTVTQ